MLPSALTKTEAVGLSLYCFLYSIFVLFRWRSHPFMSRKQHQQDFQFWLRLTTPLRNALRLDSSAATRVSLTTIQRTPRDMTKDETFWLWDQNVCPSARIPLFASRTAGLWTPQISAANIKGEAKSGRISYRLSSWPFFLRYWMSPSHRSWIKIISAHGHSSQWHLDLYTFCSAKCDAVLCCVNFSGGCWSLSVALVVIS